MDISTKGRYGLRALIDMAVYASGDPVTLQSIADRQGLSVKYLEQVFSMLRKAELVRSIKGAQGGYVLASPAESITAGAALRALEGELSVSPEQASGGAKSAESMRDTLQELLWDKLNASVALVMDHVSIAELADRYRAKVAQTATMYYI